MTDQNHSAERARRTALRSLAALGTLPLSARLARAAQPIHADASTVACVLVPAMTEGPFFVDAALERSDLRTDTANPGVRQAVPLDLTIRAVNVREGCGPLPGMQIDIWHTDALGRYSGIEDQRGENFCRAHQSTDAAGATLFRTVYPGWYPGRTIHIHVKARRFDARRRRTYEFTTQIFFPEALNDAVMALPPYDSRGPRTTRNARDGIYGDATRLITQAAMRSDGTRAITAAITLGLDLRA